MAVRLAVVSVVLTLGAVGCDKPRLKTHPVQMKVLFNRKPVTDAIVVLHPQGSDAELRKLRPSGRVDTEGELSVTTYEPGDGAPVGIYKLTVHWRSPVEGSKDEEMANSGEDRLGGRFSDPTTSPFDIEVKEGPNQYDPVDLAKRPGGS